MKDELNFTQCYYDNSSLDYWPSRNKRRLRNNTTLITSLKDYLYVLQLNPVWIVDNMKHTYTVLHLMDDKYGREASEKLRCTFHTRKTNNFLGLLKNVFEKQIL